MRTLAAIIATVKANGRKLHDECVRSVTHPVITGDGAGGDHYWAFGGGGPAQILTGKNGALRMRHTPTGDARQPFSVQYYLVAIIFILFDIEAIFLYPWALVYHDLRLFGFIEMLLYIIILLAGYIYLWKRGALDWNR